MYGLDVLCGISKGTTQNILPIHWKMWFLFTGQNLRDSRAHKCFWNTPQFSVDYTSNEEYLISQKIYWCNNILESFALHRIPTCSDLHYITWILLGSWQENVGNVYRHNLSFSKSYVPDIKVWMHNCWERIVALKIIACCSITQTPTRQWNIDNVAD